MWSTFIDINGIFDEYVRHNSYRIHVFANKAIILPMTTLKTLYRVLVLIINVSQLTYHLSAQSRQQIPFDIDFAGVAVRLNEQGREKLQREVEQLYTDRAGLRRDVESLRQLTPLLEPLLKAKRLPMDYRYAVLPFAGDESAGYWNLSPNRALALRMAVNDAVDERYHPILATEAVAPYLSQLQKASNNHVLTLLRYIQSDSLSDRSTGKVDSTYLLLDAGNPSLIWEIIARKLAFEQEELLFRPVQTYLLYEYRTGAGYSLRTISRQLQLGEDRFKPFNAWLKATQIPDQKVYPVLVRVTADEFPTVKSRADVRAKLSQAEQADVGFPVLTKLPPSTVKTYESAVFYTINDRLGVQAQSCDNVITLAYYGNIAIKMLLSYNELSYRDVIQPGRIYYIKRKARRAKVPFHIVQGNQALREIADMYGVRLKSLLKFNRLQPTQRMQTGRVVWLQKKRPKRQPVEYRQPVEDIKPVVEDVLTVTPSPLVDSLPRQTDSLSLQPVQTTVAQATLPVKDSLDDVANDISPALPDSSDESPGTLRLHTVRQGQTYYGISQLYGVTLKQIYAWNNLSERVLLKVGQELIVDLTRKRLLMRPKRSVETRQKPLPKPAVTVKTPIVESAKRIVYHIVRAGQTVYRVALINKVSVLDLMRWNNLTDYTIEIGQRLLIRK